MTTRERLVAAELDFMRTDPRHREFHRKSHVRLVNDRPRTIADEIPGTYPAPFNGKRGRK